ncbi:4-hydroxy-tetrahydrodipicolinate synthase [compost metagenome]
MHTLRKDLGEQVAFFNGSNPLALGAFAAGALGWCTAAANLIPELNITMYESIQKNDLHKAQDIFYKQLNLLKYILAKGLPRAIKSGLEILGEDGGELRGPLKPLNSQEVNELATLLNELKN